MIKFTVLGGYLGAGKTTLVNQILRHNNASTGEVKRIALLINDFGDINIDAQLIESQSDTQINLANGCVCCTLTDGFSSALDTLMALDPQPDHIIVEASGVADVNNLSQYGNGIDMRLAGIVVVADAESVREKAVDKYVSRTIQRQLKAADLILLNKVDVLTKEETQLLMTWLIDLSEGAPVVPCEKCDVPLEMVLGIQVAPEDRRSAESYRHEHYEHEHYEHEHYSSWSYTFEKPITPRALNEFADNLGPEVLRCKGLFSDKAGGSLELQTVGKRKEITVSQLNVRSCSQVVAIGLKGKIAHKKLDALAVKLLNFSSITNSE